MARVPYSSTGIYIKPDHWNPGDKEIDPHIKRSCSGYRLLNNTLVSVYERIEQELMKLIETNSVPSFRNATSLKNYISDELAGNDNMTFTDFFHQYIADIEVEGTASSYKYTLTGKNA